MEVNILRWKCGTDRVRNNDICGSVHICDIVDKQQESRLRWYGHILRKVVKYGGNKCLNSVHLCVQICAFSKKKDLV